MNPTPTIVITGASKGIGAETAYQIAEKGYSLILGSRDQERLKNVAARCLQLGAANVSISYLDLADVDSIDSFIEHCKHVSPVINVLVNNAGIGHISPFAQVKPGIVRKIMEVNVLGTMYLTRLMAAYMMKQRKGQIVTVASLAGKVPSPNMAVYGASKAALISFQDSIRIELKPYNIQVTTINPGPVKTEFFDAFDPERNYLHNMKWFAITPEQVANKIVQGIQYKRREVNLPWILGAGAKLSSIFPHITDWAYSYLINLRTTQNKGESK